MIEQLNIKCPSCGIILEVRNSKHEAVKRIVCPNCKKQLAINFQEEEKPTVPQKPLGSFYYGKMRIALQEGINSIQLPGCECVEIRAVRLRDGNSKCIVRPLSKDKPIKLNGVPLDADDELSLALGDELQIDDTLLVFGRQGKIVTQETTRQERDKDTAPKNEYLKWVIMFATLVVAFVAVWLLKPSNKEPGNVHVKEVVHSDSIELVDEPSKGKPTKTSADEDGRNPKTVTPRVAPPKAVKSLTNYDLEQLAKDGNVEAQFELGNRLVHGKGGSTIIRGLNYLDLASRNGSSKANEVRQKAVHALQQRATAGDSIAIYILESIN